MNVTTYKSDKAWPDKRWLASLDIKGNGSLLMSFFAPSEQEAIDKANNWIKTYAPKSEGHEKPMDDTELAGAGKGSHLVGKIWMIHTHTREKIRIDESEKALYEGRGYAKGGPRSK